MVVNLRNGNLPNRVQGSLSWKALLMLSCGLLVLVPVGGCLDSVPPMLQIREIAIEGPASTPAGGIGNYMVVATMGDGRRIEMTEGVSWSVLSGPGSMSAGTYTAPDEVMDDTPVRIMASVSALGMTFTNTLDITVTVAGAALEAVVITGPTSVPEGGVGNFVATATYADGSTRDVTRNATWSVIRGPGSIDSRGIYLAPGSITSSTQATIHVSYQEDQADPKGKVVAIEGTKDIAVLGGPSRVASLKISGPDTVTEGSSCRLTATATYTDGSTSDVTQNTVWSVQSGPGTINASGVYLAPHVAADTDAVVVGSFKERGILVEASKPLRIINQISRTPEALTVTGPQIVDEGGSASYTLTVSYDDGSSAQMTNQAHWSIINGPGSIQSGVYQAPEQVSSNTAVTIGVSYTEDFVTLETDKQITVVDLPSTLTGVRIDGPEAVDEGGVATYTLTASFSDGTSQTVTSGAVWSAEPGSIGADGVYTAPASVQQDTAAAISASYTVGSQTCQAVKDIVVRDVVAMLTGISISGPASVDEGTGATYTAVAVYENNSTADVTAKATWSIVSGPGSISGGVYSAPAIVTADTQATIRVSYLENGISRQADKIITVVNDVRIVEGVTLSGPTEVSEGGTGRFVLTAVYDDGAKADVTASGEWTLVSGPGSFTSPGVYSAPASVTANVDVSFTVRYSEGGVTKEVDGGLVVKNTVAAVVSLVILGPASVAEGQTGSYTATVTYDDQTSADVTSSAVWSVSSGPGSISGGVYTAPADVAADAPVTLTAAYTARSSGETGQATATQNVTVTNSSISATSSSTWQNFAVDPQTGLFGMAFDAVPSGGNVDALTGLSQGECTGYAGSAATVRFNVEGYLDAFHATAANPWTNQPTGWYVADRAISYAAGQKYHFRVVADVRKGTYSVYVTVPGQAEQVLAADYPFRSQSGTVSQLDHWHLQAGAGSHQVSNVSVAPVVIEGTLAVTPTDGLIASGSEGGPFSPSSRTYTLTNTGTLAMEWQAAKTQNWLTLSSSGGVVEGGESVALTVSINANAGSLAARSTAYTDTVTLVNLTNGQGDTSRSVSLTVDPIPPGVLTVSPADGLTSSGPEGGPFSPSSKTYTLSNSGGQPISWTAGSAPSWISLSKTGGTLDPNASETVTVSLSAQALAEQASPYTGTVTFINTTNHTGDTTRSVSLTVTSGGGTPPNASFAVTQTSGVSPLGVVFDATATTSPTTARPFHDLDYSWSFGDSGATFVNRPDVDANQAKGPIVAHVFELPSGVSSRTYTVTLTVRDATGAVAQIQKNITVSAFSGSTYYVSNSAGNDSNSGTQAAPFKTWQKAMSVLFASNGPRRVLFQRGETWTISSGHSASNLTGPYVIGAYGSATSAKPMIRCTNQSRILSLYPTVLDVRIMDIDFDGPYPTASAGDGINMGSNCLLLRSQLTNFYCAIGNGMGRHNGDLVVDCKIFDNAAYGMFTGPTGSDAPPYHVAILACDFDQSTSHLLRTYVGHSVVSYNTFRRTVKHQIKFCGTYPARTEFAVISNNRFLDPGDQGLWMISAGPEGNVPDQIVGKVHNIIFEHNLWKLSTSGGKVAIQSRSADDVTIRNNVFMGWIGPVDLSDGTSGVTSYLNWHIYNNSFHSPDTRDLIFVRAYLPVTNMVIRNNITSGPVAGAGSYVRALDMSATDRADLTCSNNIWYLPNHTGAQLFRVGGIAYTFAAWSEPGGSMVNPCFVAGSDLRLSLGDNPGTSAVEPRSPALNTGDTVPTVRDDFQGTSRPRGSAYDIGAYEED